MKMSPSNLFCRVGYSSSLLFPQTVDVASKDEEKFGVTGNLE
jgi:cellobiose-specific phosphotransferase system component IIB